MPQLKRSILKVEDIHFEVSGMKILKGISFSLRENEILGIIGPNGAGKTTLLETILGFLPKSDGTVEYNDSKKEKELVFYLPDKIQIFPEHTLIEVLDFFRAQFHCSEKKLKDMISLFHLDLYLKKKVAELSKGFQKRAGLAIALMSPGKILFLDEPFDGLDLIQTLEIIEILKNEVRVGRSILVSIHQLSDAEKFCDRILILNEGIVLACGSLEELLQELNLGPVSSLEAIFLSILRGKI